VAVGFLNGGIQGNLGVCRDKGVLHYQLWGYLVIDRGLRPVEKAPKFPTT